MVSFLLCPLGRGKDFQPFGFLFVFVFSQHIAKSDTMAEMASWTFSRAQSHPWEDHNAQLSLTLRVVMWLVSTPGRWRVNVHETWRLCPEEGRNTIHFSLPAVCLLATAPPQEWRSHEIQSNTVGKREPWGRILEPTLWSQSVTLWLCLQTVVCEISNVHFLQAAVRWGLCYKDKIVF